MEMIPFEYMPTVMEWSVRILVWTTVYYAYKGWKTRSRAGTYDNGA